MGDLHVIGIAPIRSVIVRGLRAFPLPDVAPITVRFENCLGPLVPADSLPAGAEGLTLALQAVVPAAAGGGLLSSPSSLLVTFDVP